jgi:hypothetical protein
LRQKKSTLGEHLALLSVKYNIYPNEVFQALITARNNEKAVCGNLTVEYRGKVKGETIFLITKDSAVVAQFRVGEEFLLRKDNPFESWMSTDTKHRINLHIHSRLKGGHETGQLESGSYRNS